nr:hypothetical protein [Nitrosomonas supralitoralis]
MSEASWTKVLIDLKQRGLKGAPRLAAGDGSLGFWETLAQSVLGRIPIISVAGGIKPPIK